MSCRDAVKPLNIKSTPRPSREKLSDIIASCEVADLLKDDYRVGALIAELLALQHGAEELAHKWRDQAKRSHGSSFADGAAFGLVEAADELDKLLVIRVNPAA